MEWPIKLDNIRLSTRITVSVLVLVAAAALGLIWIEAAHRRDLFISERQADLGEALRLNEVRLRQAIDTLRRDVRFLADTPPISGIIRATRNYGYDPRDHDRQEAWEARLQHIFQAFLTARPEYCRVSYIGVADQGRELVRANQREGRGEVASPAALRQKAGRDYYQAALKLPPPAVHLSPIGFDHQDDQVAVPPVQTIHAAIPVLADDGEPFGLVVVGMRVEALLRAAAAGLPAGVLAYITDPAGQYLLYPQEPAQEPGENILRDFPALGAIFDPQGPQVMPLEAVAGPKGGQYLTASRIHYDPDNPAQFLLLAYHLPGELAELATAIPSYKIGTGFALLLITCAIVFFILRRTFAPLAQLTAAADEISSGKRYFALPPGRGGEIGSLTLAFGAMLNELSRREQEILSINERLERQVDERNQALTAANQRLTAELRRQKVIIETAQAGFWLTSRDGILLEVNQAYARMSGYAGEELVGLHISKLEVKESQEEVREHIARLRRDGHDRFETRHRRKNGEIIEIEVSATFLPEEEQLFVFCLDISERKRAEEEIRALAFYDSLTRLANRRLLLEHLKAALAASERHDDCGALLFIDMDRFKIINDTCGHECGDAMLVEVAARIKSCLRERDLAARFGGDEFVVLLEELDCRQEEAARKAEVVAEKIRSALARPYLLNGNLQHSSPSIGVCLYHGRRTSVDSLLQKADHAMYEAKSAGRNTIRFANRDPGEE